MKKWNLIVKIIITVCMGMALLTMFLPYVNFTEADVAGAFEKTFDGYEIDDETSTSDEEDEDEGISKWFKPLSGIKIVKKLSHISIDKNFEMIHKVKLFIIVFMIEAWIFALATIVVCWLGDKKIKHILSVVFSLLSLFMMLSVFVFLPKLAGNAILVSVEENLIDNDNIEEVLLADALEDTVVVKLGEFARHLLNNIISIGYWLFISFAVLAFACSIVGLILACKKAKKNSSQDAKIMGLSGTYEGATIEIGGGISLGRDSKLCQLILKGDYVSRKHCRIDFNEITKKFIVTDYSSNGTYIVGGRRLDENVPTELEKGTIIRIGKKGDTFRLG